MRSPHAHVSKTRTKNAAANWRAVGVRKNGTSTMGENAAAIHDKCAAFVSNSPAPIHSAAIPVRAVD